MQRTWIYVYNNIISLQTGPEDVLLIFIIIVIEVEKTTKYNKITRILKRVYDIARHCITRTQPIIQ